MRTQDVEQKMTLWAVICALAAIVCLGAAFEFGGAAPRDLARVGDDRTLWLDEKVAPALNVRPASRSSTALGEATASKGLVTKVTTSGRMANGTRREDLGLVVPETIAVHEEMALRRNLSELLALDQADRQEALRIARTCEGCEEGVADADASAAFGRDSFLNARAKLVSRGESLTRVARELEFVQD